MANNETRLNTRLLLRYDSYDNWTAKNPTLLAGEVAVATIANEDGKTSLNYNSVNLPQVLIKVGDGVTAYNLLPFASALAADVHPWAKETSAQFETRVKGLVNGLNFAAAGDLDALEALVGPISNIASSYNSGYNLGPVQSTTEAIASLNSKVKADIDGRVGNVADIAGSYNSGYNLGPAQSTTEAIVSLNITAKTEIDKKADAEATTNALYGKVDKVNGYSLVSDAEIARLADVDNYDDAEVRSLIGDNADAIGALANKVGTVPEGQTVMGIITNIQEDAYDDTELRGLIGDNADAIDAIEADYLKAADKTELTGLITAETERAEGIEGGLRTDVDAIKGDYLKASDKTELEGKITAEETRAKGVEDGLAARVKAVEDDYLKAADKTALQDQITANANAITANANAITTLTNGVDPEKIDGLNDLIEWADTHAPEVNGIKTDIEANAKAIADEATRADAAEKALAGRLDTLEAIDHDAYVAADTALKTELQGEIDADVTAAINAEVLRADGAYDAKGAAAAAQTAAEATAAGALASARTEITAEIGTAIAGEVSRADGKYEEKGVAQGIVDALNLATTYEPIGAESRAIAAAEGKVNALANGAVATNTADIAAIKNADTGILAQAKKHTNDEIAKLSAADGALTLLDKRVKANEDKLAGVTGTVLDAINAAKAGIATTAAAGLVKASKAVTVAEDGTLGIAKVSTDTLFNGANELVLFGGTANDFNN